MSNEVEENFVVPALFHDSEVDYMDNTDDFEIV